MKRIFFALFSASLAATGFSQANSRIYFFDKDLIETISSKAVLIGNGGIDNGLWLLSVRNKKDNHIIFKAHYADSSLTMMEGSFMSFYADGSHENEGIYEHGKEKGLWRKWDSRGKITDSIFFENGIPVMAARFQYNIDDKINSVAVKDVKNHKTFRTFYGATDKPEFKDTLNDPESDTFNKPERDTVNAAKDDGDKIFTRTEIEASFPGGEGAWTTYITKEVEKNIDALTRQGLSGTCRARFIVDKEGNVSDIHILTMQGSKLANVLLDALRKSPKWEPAQQNGHKVTAYRELPFTFTIFDQ